MNTETPETDLYFPKYFENGQEWVRAGFARRLEHERDEARYDLANAIYDLADERALADRLAESISTWNARGNFVPPYALESLNIWKEARK